jgi:RNA polymerase sigma-70 factor, ECF subfamily
MSVDVARPAWSARGREVTMPASDEFARRTDPFRRELLAHCYRILGSVHDAEDLVQETLLRAWRSYGQFDDRRASLRTWLYRIATNARLTALEQRGRRAMPSDLADPSAGSTWPLDDPRHEITWLQPIPDTLLTTAPADPATIVASRGSVRLALIAALQHLPARQRAVLILRDVLAWRASEVAELLGTSTAAVNSALQRARAQLAEVTPVEEQIAEPGDAEQRELLDRYATAFVNADVTTLAGLLLQDVELEMPPFLTWFSGRDAVGSFISARASAAPHRWRTVPTRANGQAALAVYLLGADDGHHAHSVQVFTFAGSGIARIVAFVEPELFPIFGLPLTFAAAEPAPRR